MSGKDKIRKFRENETFDCLFQPSTEEVLNIDHSMKGEWGKRYFKNNNPIVLELGCGKGEYTIALAEMFPDKNFIGIDIKGARLWKGAKYAHLNKLSNVAFVRTRIEFITSIFAQNEISEIWITFADPQIKKAKKRLTHPLFLSRYSKFLTEDGIIHLKTDSRLLHEYTKATAQHNGLRIIEANHNIYQGSGADEILSIKTFYESNYLAQGIAITYLSFSLKGISEFSEPQWDETLYK